MHRAKEIDLSRVKSHLGRQDHGFEELCCQLFSKQFAAFGTYYRRPRGGDDGAEAVFRDQRQRVVAAIQVKFSENRGGSVPWAKITDAIRTTLATNRLDSGLHRFVVAIWRNVDDNQWLKHKAEWEEAASSLGYQQAVEFELWSESKLLTLLLDDKFAAQRAYWFDVPQLSMGRCSELTGGTISKLQEMGRYFKDGHTPVAAEDEMHWFMRTEHARQAFVDACQKALGRERAINWKSIREWPEERQLQWIALRKPMDVVVSLLGDGTQIPRNLMTVVNACEGYRERRGELFHWLWPHLRPPKEAGGSDSRSPEARSDYDQSREHAEGSIEWAFDEGSAAGYGAGTGLLVRGGAGGGKTHLLAAFCERYLASGGSVLFTEGARFMDATNARSQLSSWLGLSSDITFEQFLDAFDSLSLATNRPGLLCIDGLNESTHRKIWKHGLDDLFAAIKKRPNLKLLVSCRRDYVESTLPNSLLHSDSRDGWRSVEQNGLGSATYEAMTRYMDHFQVKGTHAVAWRRDFENPLFLKVFCEAYQGKEPPAGAQSFTKLLPVWAEEKSKDVLEDEPASGARLRELLSKLAGPMVENNDFSLPRPEVIRLIRELGLNTKPETVYDRLLKAEVLGQFIKESPTAPQERVRFVYHRVLDYFATASLWPVGGTRPAVLIERISLPSMRGHRAGILGLLALRLPEEDGTELPDLISSEQLRSEYVVRAAFLESIAWRTERSVTDDTRRWMLKWLSGHRGTKALDHLLPLAAMPESPWNADKWDHWLRASPLLERETWWTKYLNHNFQWSSEGAARVLKDAEELPEACLTNDRIVLLLGTALGWMLSTTHQVALKRIAEALARLLERRIFAAMHMVQRFADVDDPQIIERVMFAVAHAAAFENSASDNLGRLAQMVFAKFIERRDMVPNTMLRYYASVVIRSAEKVRAWQTPVNLEAPKAPWPELIAEDEEAILDKMAPHDDALAEVVWGTRTEKQMTLEKWHYEMRRVCVRHENRGLDQKPHRENLGGHIPEELARRYILKRVQQLGLVPGVCEPWAAQEAMEVPKRTQIDRFGKKLQCTALHEFAGYLEDHYHPAFEFDREPLTHEAPDYRLEGFLDPYKPLPRKQNGVKHRPFVPEENPWWIRAVNPLPIPLTEAQRERFVLSGEWRDPCDVLESDDPSTRQRWVLLQGHFTWQEPVPCWENPEYDRAPYSKHEMGIRGAFLPSSWTKRGSKWLSQMTNQWLEDPPSRQRPAEWLRDYPNNTSDDWGQIKSPRNKGASMACVYYSSLDSESGSQDQGNIPSPFICRALGLRWSGQGLDFESASKSEADVILRKGSGHSVCLIRRESLDRILSEQAVVFGWQLWGCRLLGPMHMVQRQVWAALQYAQKGQVTCLAGRTRLIGLSVSDKGTEGVPWDTKQ